MNQKDKTLLTFGICFLIAVIGFTINHLFLYGAAVGAIAFAAALYFERKVGYQNRMAYSIGISIAATVLLSISIPSTILAVSVGLPAIGCGLGA